MKRHNDDDWMPYCGRLLVAAFVKMVSCLANSIVCIYTYADKTEFVFLHIGSNYLCTNLEIALSQNGSHFLVEYEYIRFMEFKRFSSLWSMKPYFFPPVMLEAKDACMHACILHCHWLKVLVSFTELPVMQWFLAWNVVMLIWQAEGLAWHQCYS